MPTKLTDAELKVMDVLWEEGELSAVELAKVMNARVGWARNTTYTVAKKLVEKGAVKRGDPFICQAAVSRESVQREEAAELIDKLFDGSAELFLSAYVSGKKLSSDEIDGLRRIVEKLK